MEQRFALLIFFPVVIAREAQPTAAIHLKIELDCFVATLLAMTKSW
jgi:hypothetical protein